MSDQDNRNIISPAKGSDDSIKIGLLGGSFDPIHNAHIALAKAAYESLGLQSIQLIPARDPWQKSSLGASPEQRLAMLDLACSDYPFISVNSLEINRSGPTYTIDTLELLAKNAKYYWLMGTDQLENFCTWHRWQDIIKYVNLAVAKRPESNLNPSTKLLAELGDKQILQIPFEPLNISSTKIKQNLAANIDCSTLMNARVLQYIIDNQIYQSN